ncbi:MAG: hypothetical protein QOI73_1947 [Solirubrobacteraceae bacterium]|nr:hypothetical protein [Solirubrobacteraceae bacterium]
MSKLALAIRDVHYAETELHDELLALGERHKADHDVYHLTGTLAKWAQANVAALAPHGERYGADLDAAAASDGSPGVIAGLREKTSELIGRRPEAGLLLLSDMRTLYLLACEASIDWVILGQGAQGARDQDLLAVVSSCHPQTLRTMRWATAKLKESSPQVLNS